jgi:hypothetical protein
LFEAYIILKYLGQNDEKMSKRFLDHNIIIRKKLADSFKNSYGIQEGISDEAEYERLIDENGREYIEAYGWMYPDIKDKNERNFSSLCRIVGNKNELAIYKLSCEMLHSNSLSSGGSLSGEEDITIGPCESGIEIPLFYTMYTQVLICKESINNIIGTSGFGAFLTGYVMKVIEKTVLKGEKESANN